MKKLLIAICLIMLSSILFGWDKYSNETKELLKDVTFDEIISYDIFVDSKQIMTFETKDLKSHNGRTPDTVMHIWKKDDLDGRQISYNDDSGGRASKISIELDTGEYTVYVYSYSSYSKGSCDLYVNNILKLDDYDFGGEKIYIRNPAETKFILENLSGYTDKGYTIIKMNSRKTINTVDENNYGREVFVESKEDRGYLLLGTKSDTNSCYSVSGKISYIEDNNLEFICLAGNADLNGNNRFAYFGNKFISNFPYSYYYNYSSPIALTEYHVGGDYPAINLVDFAIINSHGDIGVMQGYYGEYLDVSSNDSASGSGRGNFRIKGDLEYISFLSCDTVKIEDKTNSDWLENRGWKTKELENGEIQKGLFDGIHLVVGFHNEYLTQWGAYWTEEYISDAYFGKKYAEYLNNGYSIWGSWKRAKQETDNEWSNWFNDFNSGTASMIYIDGCEDETIFDFKTPDYKYGDSGYRLGWKLFGPDA